MCDSVGFWEVLNIEVVFVIFVEFILVVWFTAYTIVVLSYTKLVFKFKDVLVTFASYR